MNTYEELSLILGVAMLIVTILIYVDNKNASSRRWFPPARPRGPGAAPAAIFPAGPAHKK